MAINILKRPHQINPSNIINDWIIQTDNNNTQFLKVEVLDNDDNLIVIKKLHGNTVSFDLSQIVRNLVNSVIPTSQELNIVGNLLSYKLRVTEILKDSNNVLSNGSVAEFDGNYVFDSFMTEFEMRGYNENTYNINPHQFAKFLTNSKQVKEVRENDTEYLKIFNTHGIAHSVKIQFYDGDNDIVQTVIQPLNVPVSTGGETPTKVLTLNVSPSVIWSLANEDTKELSNQYRVTIVDAGGNERTEPRIYRMDEDNRNCHLQVTRVMYKNSVGGYDSVKFYNRIETVNIDRQHINRSFINGYSNGVYRGSKEVLNVAQTSTYIATSGLLDDYDGKLLKEILTTNKAYVLIDGIPVEILIDNRNYKVLQRHVNSGKMNRLELQFTAPFSLEELHDDSGNIPYNNNSDPTYLGANDQFVVDSFTRYVTVNY